MYINEDSINQIRERADIVSTVSDYLTLNKSGANLTGLCPFHSEKTPSFTVSEAKQFYHCFGCGESGDSITFIMKMENLDFKEAVSFLADKLGIELDGKEIDTKELEEKARLYNINKETGRYFHHILLKDKMALNYLQQRGIEYRDIKRFGIGFIPDQWENLYKFLMSKSYKAEEVEALGLINKRKNGNGYYDRFRNRIMFPIIDRKNQVIGFGGRVIDDSMPKYLNSKESLIFDKGNNLYGLNLVKKYSDKKRIVLVEGYMDVIALFSEGINYSVASLGTALTQTQARLLKRYGEEVYIVYDSDEAGVKATLRAIDTLEMEDIKPKIVQLPEGMDPDDYINNEGKIKFERLLKNALSSIEYNIDLNKRKYNLNDVEEKIIFTKKISSFIKKIKSPIEQDAYIEKIAHDTGISKDAIQKEIRTTDYKNDYKKDIRKTHNINKNISHINSKIPTIKSAHIKAQLDLINLMIVDKEYFYLIEERLLGVDFSNGEFKEIYGFIKNKYENNDILKINDIINAALSEGIGRNLLSDIKDELLEYKPTNIEQIIIDLTNTLILNNLEEKRIEILKSIKDIEEDPEKMETQKEEFMKLCMDLTSLNIEIKSIRYK